MPFHENKIYLIQSDTTAGFVSKDYRAINALKGRDENTPCVITTNSFASLKKLAAIPLAHKNLIRRAKKSSFIYANKLCIRVSKDSEYNAFLANFSGAWAYSSSANAHGADFDEKWARQKADEIIGSSFSASAPSSIYRLGKTGFKKLR